MDRDVNKSLLEVKIIGFAMMTGMVLFAGVTVFLNASGTGAMAPELSGVLFPVLLVTAGAAFGLSIAVRKVLLGQARKTLASRSEDLDPLDAVIGYFRLTALVGMAAAESFGLFSLVVYLLTGVTVALIVTAFAIFMILIRLPRQDQIDDFVREASL